MRKLLFFILLGLAFSCKDKKEKEDETVDPNCFKSAFQMGNSNIDLTNEVETFNATFPSPVTYNLILKGKSSGANKTYSGTSDVLEVIWDGDSDNGIKFIEETVEVKLEIPCKTTEGTIQIKPNNAYTCASIKSLLKVSSSTPNLNIRPDTITASFSNPVLYTVSFQGQTSGAEIDYKGFSDTIGIIWKGQSLNDRFFIAEKVNVTLSFTCGTSITQTINIQPYDWSKDGVLISDFEGNGYVDNSVRLQGYNATGWSSYYSEPMSKISGLDIASSPLQAIQGNKYFSVQSQAGEGSWFGGGIYFSVPTAFPDNNSWNSYFNLFVNGGTHSTTISITLISGAGINYQYILPIDWQGWKLVSIRMSDFKNSSGDNLTDLSKVKQFDIGLNGTNSTGQTLEANFDYLIITKDKPLFFP